MINIMKKHKFFTKMCVPKRFKNFVPQIYFTKSNFKIALHKCALLKIINFSIRNMQSTESLSHKVF